MFAQGEYTAMAIAMGKKRKDDAVRRAQEVKTRSTEVPELDSQMDPRPSLKR